MNLQSLVCDIFILMMLLNLFGEGFVIYLYIYIYIFLDLMHQSSDKYHETIIKPLTHTQYCKRRVDGEECSDSYTKTLVKVPPTQTHYSRIMIMI